MNFSACLISGMGQSRKIRIPNFWDGTVVVGYQIAISNDDRPKNMIFYSVVLN